jgi:hypothetical protein
MGSTVVRLIDVRHAVHRDKIDQPRQHLEQHGTEGPDVRAFVDGLPTQYAGRRDHQFHRQGQLQRTTVFGTGKNVHLVERFTRVDADTIDYQFTVDDATVFTRPWTAAIPMTQIKGPLFEYACHEGNYGLPQILSGPRVQEKAEGAANKGRGESTGLLRRLVSSLEGVEAPPGRRRFSGPGEADDFACLPVDLVRWRSQI